VTASVQHAPAEPLQELPPAPRGSLVKAELHRFRARRFIQVLAGIGVLGWAAAIIIGLFTFGTPTEADYAAAQAQVDQIIQENETYRQQCLDDPPSDAPEGVPADEVCGPPLTESDIGGVESFLGKAPFDLAASGTVGAVAFAGLASALAFVVGATWIGAEWSSRSIVALLFWVPRRLQVMGTKLGVLAVAAAVIGVVAQAAWLGMALILRAVAGSDRALPKNFWGELLATQGRGVLLTVLVALMGFGLTNLIRNTGAALGIGFVYFAVIETAIRILRPAWEPFLLSNNAAGLISPGGITVFIYDNLGPTGYTEPRQYLIHNLQAGIVLGAVAAVIVGVGVLLFQRRDLH
jgi:hypothetical protein